MTIQKRYAILLGAILFLNILFNSVSAYNITFEINGPLIYETPSVCILEPKSNLGTDTQIKNWANEAKYAVSEWEVKLKEKEMIKERKSNWEINIIEISQSQQESYNYENCFVIILFEYRPYGENLGGETSPLEWDENRSLITIYTIGIGPCTPQDVEYYCSTGTRTTQEIGTIVRHEFGHALGLGHYTSDDDKINEDWARGRAPSPSIMTNFLYEIVKEQQIRPLDVDKVREVYGENGFKNTQKETKEETLPDTDSSLPSRLTVQIPEWIKKNALWWFEGKIGDTDFVLGLEYLIEQNIMKIPPTEGSSNNSQQIPPWIKNNAKWWADGQISDDDFVKGIQYLISSGIMKISTIENTSLCQGTKLCITGTVEKIVDGDTIYVKGEKIRLSLTNAPEKNEAGYAEATQFTSILCPIGSTVIVDQDDKQPYDVFGRTVGKVFCGGKMLNEELLLSNHGKILTQYCSKSEYANELWAKKFGC